MGDEINELYSTILERKNSGEEGSYTAYLFQKGLEKILKKVGEESTEVVISALGNDKEEQINEICDLTYHLLVLMAELNIPLEMVEEELKKRSKKINNFKGERKEIDNI
ncbi:phosphoribosyl-ATP diphosphatase [Clostridium paraputrificum]|uniref:phosphoribosyl-ATP diphosphatase n=1 Tax=Clostridium TaxID=1485 RepID=UPI003D327869